MRILVTGGRSYSDRVKVYATLDSIHAKTPITCVIQGECPYGGADKLADDWAVANGASREPYPADWYPLGSGGVRDRSAGPKRNSYMVKHSRADLCVSFPGDRGTADCTEKARAAGIEVLEVR